MSGPAGLVCFPFTFDFAWCQLRCVNLPGRRKIKGNENQQTVGVCKHQCTQIKLPFVRWSNSLSNNMSSLNEAKTSRKEGRLNRWEKRNGRVIDWLLDWSIDWLTDWVTDLDYAYVVFWKIEFELTLIVINRSELTVSTFCIFSFLKFFFIFVFYLLLLLKWWWYR
jgi:hypothetical protein